MYGDDARISALVHRARALGENSCALLINVGAAALFSPSRFFSSPSIDRPTGLLDRAL